MNMKRKNHLRHCCNILLTCAAILLAAPVRTQSQTMQSPGMVSPDRDDATRRQLASFDSFLDSHPEVAEQVRKDPSLVNNEEFVEKHSALEQYLQQHPEIREDQGRDRDVPRGELANMDHFMDSHPEIAEQLRKDPSLVDNKQFVQSHPDLQRFLADHPGVREEYKKNPNAFMKEESGWC